MLRSMWCCVLGVARTCNAATAAAFCVLYACVLCFSLAVGWLVVWICTVCVYWPVALSTAVVNARVLYALCTTCMKGRLSTARQSELGGHTAPDCRQ